MLPKLFADLQNENGVCVWNGESGAVTRPRNTFQKREKNKLGEIDAHLIFSVCLLLP